MRRSACAWSWKRDLRAAARQGAATAEGGGGGLEVAAARLVLAHAAATRSSSRRAGPEGAALGGFRWTKRDAAMGKARAARRRIRRVASRDGPKPAVRRYRPHTPTRDDPGRRRRQKAPIADAVGQAASTRAQVGPWRNRPGRRLCRARSAPAGMSSRPLAKRGTRDRSSPEPPHARTEASPCRHPPQPRSKTGPGGHERAEHPCRRRRRRGNTP